MRFPRFIAGGAGVRGTGLVRAQDIGALTNVGDAEFRAIEQAGRAIGAVSDLGTQAFMSRRALDDTIESGKATQRVQESWNQAEDSVDNFNPAHDLPLPGDPKYLETLTTFGTRERDAFLQSSLRDIEKDATKIFSGIRNPKTKAQLVKQYNDFYADRTKNLKGKLDKVLNDYQIDEMGKLARDAALNGNMETSDFYVDKMAEHGLITNVKATSLKAGFLELSVKSQATELTRIGLYDEARELITSSSLEVLDKESFGNMIDAAENRAVADGLTERKEQQRQLENDLYDGLADGSKNVTDIARSPLDATAKRRLVNDEENFASRDIAQNWPLVDNDETVQRLESMLTSLETGQIDRTQFNQQVNAAAVGGNLLHATRDKYRALAKKGGREAIDVAVKRETDIIRNALLTRLTNRDARFIVRSQAGTLTPEEQRQAGNNAYLIQVNKHQLGMIEKEIHRLMSQPGVIDRLSGTEATAIASTVWEQFRTKTLDQKINDFKEFSGQRIPKPQGFPRDKWEELDGVGRAGVVEAVDGGMPINDILRIVGR